MGAGADIFAACRLRLVDGDASFAFPGASGFGLVLGTRRLAALVGTSTALDWVQKAHVVSAQEAQRAGLISDAITSEEGLAEAINRSLHLPAHMTAALRAAIEPESQMNDAKDLESLVRSAAHPGLRDRILAYQPGNLPHASPRLMVQRTIAARKVVSK